MYCTLQSTHILRCNWHAWHVLHCSRSSRYQKFPAQDLQILVLFLICMWGHGFFLCMLYVSVILNSMEDRQNLDAPVKLLMSTLHQCSVFWGGILSDKFRCFELYQKKYFKKVWWHHFEHTQTPPRKLICKISFESIQPLQCCTCVKKTLLPGFFKFRKSMSWYVPFFIGFQVTLLERF